MGLRVQILVWVMRGTSTNRTSVVFALMHILGPPWLVEASSGSRCSAPDAGYCRLQRYDRTHFEGSGRTASATTWRSSCRHAWYGTFAAVSAFVAVAGVAAMLSAQMGMLFLGVAQTNHCGP